MKKRPQALDLFCGAGGAAMGLHQAGFEVLGVDIKPQPNYPFKFIQADATKFPLEGNNFIWASPPCQAHTAAKTLQGRSHVDLIPAIRRRLIKSRTPYCIENVPGAPLIEPTVLCGRTFGLNVKRHRLFETSFPIKPPCACPKGHPGDWLIVFGYSALRRSRGQGTGPKKDRGKSKGKSVPHTEACAAMGIDWMTRMELSQSIPPAYSEYIGRHAIKAVTNG